ncbi:BQ2448_4727 [Microbotryum intermedium]|uniref:BQ2448_4727 protein n=1 Tax=Microbotryum intermedium TaxID=269621 RepID=A0A238FJ53_9BASI|nr:BQ2448_4727 [Microbotryum intermedium]
MYRYYGNHDPNGRSCASPSRDRYYDRDDRRRDEHSAPSPPPSHVRGHPDPYHGDFYYGNDRQGYRAPVDYDDDYDRRGAKRSRIEAYKPSSMRYDEDEYRGYAPPRGPNMPGVERYDYPVDDRGYPYSNRDMDPHAPYPPPRDSSRRGDPPPSRAPMPMNAPSPSVIFLGLPPHAKDEDLLHWIQAMTTSVESANVIFDRATGQSRRYGFGKFASVEHARSVVEPNFQRGIPWTDRVPNRDAATATSSSSPSEYIVKVNFASKAGGYKNEQGAESRGAEMRWTEDRRRDGLVPGRVTTPQQGVYVNDGTRDIGTTHSSLILLRKLDALTSEDEIWKALAGLEGVAGQTIRERGGIIKIMMARERATRSSWGFAFVKLKDVALASAVMASVMNATSYPQGFRIRKAAAAVSFCHENSFIPIYANSEWSFRGDGGQQLTYWDDKSYVTHWVPPASSLHMVGGASSNSSSQHLDSEQSGQSGGGKDMDPSEADMEAFLSSIAAEMPPELFAAEPTPPDLSTSKTDILGPKSVGAPISPGVASDTTAPRVKASSSVTAWDKSAAIGPNLQARKEKKSGETIVAKKMASHLDKWSQKQAELKSVDNFGSKPTTSEPSRSASKLEQPRSGGKDARIASAKGVPAKQASSTKTIATSQSDPTTSQLSSSTALSGDDLPYGDSVSRICLLCSRQFKSLEEISKHNRLSKLHLTNLSDPALVSRATTMKADNLAKRAAAASSAAKVDAPETPRYIDRAAARREHFHQPDKPERESKEKKRFEGPPPREELVQPNNEGIQDTNVGSKMLEKMGWSKGAGLGATGEGRAAPVMASSFAQGAGLGSAKPLPSLAIGRSGESVKDATRELTRKRYEG